MTDSVCDFTCATVCNLNAAIEVVEKATVSKTLLQKDGIKQVLFALDAGQEMSTHAVPFPGTVQVLSGALSFTLAADVHELAAGDWLGMPADAPHSLVASEPTVFLLTLLQPAK